MIRSMLNQVWSLIPSLRSIAIASCLAVLCGCHLSAHAGYPRIKGSGVTATEVRDLTGFRGIQVSGAIRANVTVGDEYSVEVSGDDNFVPLVESRVNSNDVLVLRMQHRMSYQTKSPITVTINTPELRAVDASGSAQVTIEGLVTGDFSVDCSGSSKVTIKGQVANMDIDASGASQVTATDVMAEDIDLDVSGASRVKVHAAGAIQGDVSGASHVAFDGQPDEVTIDRSGASTVNAME